MTTSNPIEPDRAAPAARIGDLANRAALLAGMRAFCDIAETNPLVPLPHRADSILTFYVTETQADHIAVHLRDVQEEQRPGYYIQNRCITGTLAGAQVAVYFGTQTGVAA